MEERQRTKRRAKTAGSPPSDDNKKRGRPRLEKRDTSATDRRRTQIRMAQRAYRQRKESTLEDLRKRVSDLTNTVELMNRAFLDCRDRLSASGLSATQMDEIRETSLHYESLTKWVRTSDEDCDVEPMQIPAPISSQVGSSDPLRVDVQVKNVPDWLDHAALKGSKGPSEPMDVGMGYTAYLSDAADMSQHIDSLGLDSQAEERVASPPKSPQWPSPNIFGAETPASIRILPELTPITTYSFQETSFGRRLHRAGLESGYQLVLNRTRRPNAYEKVFRLSPMLRDEKKLAASFKSRLARGPHEPLESRDASHVHVGGAGTHYPRWDAFGNLELRKESRHLGVISPQALPMLTSAAGKDVTVEITGFEGEWFDPYDVEGYLTEKGIFIDPQSSFVEAWMVEQPSTPGPGLTISSEQSTRTPLTADSAEAGKLLRNIEQPSISGDFPADWAEWDGPANEIFPDVGFSDTATGSWMNFLDSDRPVKSSGHSADPPRINVWESPRTHDLTGNSMMDAFDDMAITKPQLLGSRDVPLPPAAPVLPRRKPVTIDVAKFIRSLSPIKLSPPLLGMHSTLTKAVLMGSGVCLGRISGFRRRDVDRALALSSSEI